MKKKSLRKKKLNDDNVDFSKIINKLDVCISNNPKGIDLNWPKSYSELFYNQKLKEIYKRNKSPKILEINQFNIIKNFIWKKFFINPDINNEILYSKEDLKKFMKKKINYNFDIIFINDYRNIKNIYNLISFFISKLNEDGVIIIENFYFNYYLAINLVFNHDCYINDFRFNRFIIDNCLVEIKTRKNRKSSSYLLKKYFLLIYFLILDSIYRLLGIIKSIIND